MQEIAIKFEIVCLMFVVWSGRDTCTSALSTSSVVRYLYECFVDSIRRSLLVRVFCQQHPSFVTCTSALLICWQHPSFVTCASVLSIASVVRCCNTQWSFACCLLHVSVLSLATCTCLLYVSLSSPATSTCLLYVSVCLQQVQQIIHCQASAARAPVLQTWRRRSVQMSLLWQKWF